MKAFKSRLLKSALWYQIGDRTKDETSNSLPPKLSKLKHVPPDVRAENAEEKPKNSQLATVRTKLPPRAGAYVPSPEAENPTPYPFSQLMSPSSAALISSRLLCCLVDPPVIPCRCRHQAHRNYFLILSRLLAGKTSLLLSPSVTPHPATPFAAVAGGL